MADLELNKIETTDVEYKEMLEVDHPKSWLKTVSAFANTNGGALYFGFRDADKKLVGLKNVKYDSEKQQNLLIQR